MKTNIPALAVYLALTVCLSCANAQTESYKARSSTYFASKCYQLTITPTQLAACPKWDPEKDPNPPYAAAKGLGLANKAIARIQTAGDFFWQFQGLALVDFDGDWVWEGQYRLMNRASFSSGLLTTMKCWVLMDGTCIEPVITADQRNR